MGSQTFNYSGGWDTFNVPTNVNRLDFVITGGGSNGQQGGRVTGWMSVDDSLVLKILVGQAGDPNNGENGGGTATGGGGAGGDGNSGNGGDGGGGGSFIRRNTTDGSLVAAAGGAGGNSGDSGGGGAGGGSVGASGGRGTSGSNSTVQATGGTQNQGGKGGSSSSGGQFDGHDAAGNNAGDRGGAGGGSHSAYCYGGGGGGGGYKAGGGGQAASKGYAPGGGGGGGSNYTGNLAGATNTRTGGTGNGSIAISWSNPPPANQAPSPPAKSSITIAGKDGSGAPVVTRAKTTVVVRAKVSDPDAKDRVRLKVTHTSVPWPGNDNPTWGNARSDQSGLVDNNSTAAVTLDGLSQDRHYYLRLYAVDDSGKQSVNYTAAEFYTNRSPSQPKLTGPSDNSTFAAAANTTFTWNHIDPDVPDPQSGFNLRYRVAATATTDAGDWTFINTNTVENSSVSSWVIGGNTFKGNRFYEWSVRTKDGQDRWGDWQDTTFSFYVTGVTSPPVLVIPIKGIAVDVEQPVLFDWRFKDPTSSDTQKKADIRWRIVGQDNTHWITTFGQADPFPPGTTSAWTIPAGSFIPGQNYEWQVRTYDALANPPSDWSDSETFNAIATPGGGIPPLPDVNPLFVQGALGCGMYRVFIYEQGGKKMLGEVEAPLTTLSFNRVRDDMSNCTITTAGFGEDCGKVLASLRTWMHEIVLFRDNKRVWEGPITLIAYTRDAVSLEAKDVSAYLYRRIMRQGYDDRYKYDQQTKRTTGGMSVVRRAYLIAVNALAPYDPNVLPYLSAYNFADDAQEGRIVPDYSTTAWEQIDDLAATAGLDYTVVGRRIIFNDTHRPIGVLPEMRDSDFSDPPVVTEYGMQLCNYSAVTNNSGLWAAARPKQEKHDYDFYGPIEMLASSYNEKPSKDKLVEQAKRNIAHRWPAPVIVRVPDNSTLNPETMVGFDQLIPGVWILLRSNTTLRDVSQWQKLDSVTVNFAEGLEQVQVVMSPAPNGGQDPDADASLVDGG